MLTKQNLLFPASPCKQALNPCIFPGKCPTEVLPLPGCASSSQWWDARQEPPREIWGFPWSSPWLFVSQHWETRCWESLVAFRGRVGGETGGMMENGHFYGWFMNSWLVSEPRTAPRAPSRPVWGSTLPEPLRLGISHFLQPCWMLECSGRENIAALAQPHPPAEGNLVPIRASSNPSAFLACRAASSPALPSEAGTWKLLRWL